MQHAAFVCGCASKLLIWIAKVRLDMSIGVRRPLLHLRCRRVPVGARSLDTLLCSHHMILGDSKQEREGRPLPNVALVYQSRYPGLSAKLSNTYHVYLSNFSVSIVYSVLGRMTSIRIQTLLRHMLR
ncbi:hypothetical protein BDU57DRAFT_201757 [Ampelomyces quisqualis]|uniref:Uncharacterized protein n=1 Tax=Ampelomyces quisqualis TaxID=50730 RepID=A0A6A5QSS6_AMPQU|nr:hypothetical protein BDU57DRAFT_201757 [Ampelomyces quisqualis]